MTLVRQASLVTVLLLFASVASAQRDSDILSKDDAAWAFGATRQQWRDNLVGIVKTGVGTRVGDALTLKTPVGTVTTLPIYARTDTRPSRLEVTIVMAREWVTRFDDAMVANVMRDVRHQMEPEYVAEGRVQRLQDGGMRFFFTVLEKPR